MAVPCPAPSEPSWARAPAHTQSQADTHTDTSTYTATRTPRLQSATRSAPRPGGKVQEPHVPSKGSVRVSHSARRGNPSWVFLAPKILTSGEPPSARSCTRRYAVPGDQTQVRRSTAAVDPASGDQGTKAGALRPPGPPRPPAQPALGAGGEPCWASLVLGEGAAATLSG